jgi:flagellar biosynthesis protein
MQVNLDDRIPPQLYVAVAELLAWLYRLEKAETTLVTANSLSSKIAQQTLEGN